MNKIYVLVSTSIFFMIDIRTVSFILHSSNLLLKFVSQDRKFSQIRVLEGFKNSKNH